MASTNDITGQRIKTPVNSPEFLNNWDAIFGSKEKELSKPVDLGPTAKYSFNNTHVNRF